MCNQSIILVWEFDLFNIFSQLPNNFKTSSLGITEIYRKSKNAIKVQNSAELVYQKKLLLVAVKSLSGTAVKPFR